MKITKKIEKKLKDQWEINGECRSCGWHSAFYEVKDNLIEQLEHDDFETDKNDDKYIVAYCEYAAANSENHRDIKIYLRDLK